MFKSHYIFGVPLKKIIHMEFLFSHMHDEKNKHKTHNQKYKQ